jgi:dissimilatory sulfite reductase (desulfoviridin) alpha/beta subunit
MPVHREDSVEIALSVLSGRHLHKNVKSSSTCNVFVKIEVIGCPTDCSYGATETIQVGRENAVKSKLVLPL